MLLKRFEAKTLPEALARVRSEIGEHALVVETKAWRDGVLVVAARPDTAVPRTPPVAVPGLSKWTRGFQPFADKARDFGLSDRILHAVENALLGTKISLSRPGDPALPALATRVLAALIRTDGDLDSDPVAPNWRTVALVGPTGVGKTTTLAKLAGRAHAAGQRLAIVTLDTWRVAAVEQLRAFADALDVPLDVAFTPQDLRRLLQQHADKDRVFIDTTGRSPADRDALTALGGTLHGRGITSLLCLGAGTRRRDTEVILQAYEPLGIGGICLTKWDETVVPGEALSLAVERGLPLTHLTVGQQVPGDIVPADPQAIAAAAFDLEPARSHA
ncbi:MAG: hypothetical protein IPK26_19375 [Planctomycetes bacterium]|nr:hypothetical protein [Planctomycetota bacterium]